jgi:hypothetical protein
MPDLNDIQFHYDTPDLGESKTVHRITARGGPLYNELGSMLWQSKSIRNIGVSPGLERRGIATAMWHEGHRLAGENARIPQPKHSADRTKSGDAWARSVGGRLPRRKRDDA